MMDSSVMPLRRPYHALPPKPKKKTISKKEEELAKLKALFKHIVNLLDGRYGSRNVTLEAWQGLCRDVKEPEGSTIAECKIVSARIHPSREMTKADRVKLMENVFVNIIDWVETIDETHPRHHTATVVRYDTLKELQDYSKETRKFFPLEEAKESGVLSALLIHMG